MTLDQLTRDALALPAQDRASLAQTLIESLDTDVDPIDEVEQGWAEEIKRRQAAIKSGEVELIPWEEARERLRQQLAERRRA